MQLARITRYLPVQSVTASSEPAGVSNEKATSLVDGSYNTKWLCQTTTGWAYVDLGSAKVVSEYKITSGNDFPARDPKTWELQGSNTTSSWVTVASETNQTFSSRGLTRTFTGAAVGSTPYRYYRLNVTANNGDSLLMQISELQLYESASASAAADEAILSKERQFFVEVKFDWFKNGSYTHYLTDLSEYVDTVTLDRSLAGSAPSEVMLIEGAAAAEMTVTLAGKDPERDLNMVAVFSPYNGLSSLYTREPIGAEVTYRIGVDTALGTIWYPQFVGNVRTITPNRQDNSVTITALDRVEKLRVPVKFPNWSLHSYWSDRGWDLAQLARTDGVIDHCLRWARVSPTPWVPQIPNRPTVPLNGDPRDVGTQFFLTGLATHAPVVGMVDNARRQGYPKTSGISHQMYGGLGQANPAVASLNIAVPAFNPMMNDATGYAGFNSGAGFYDSVGSTAENRYWMQDRINFGTNGIHYAGFTLHNDGGSWINSNTSYVADFFIGWRMVIRLVVSNGSFRVEMRNRGSGGSSYAGVVTSWKTIPTQDHVQIDVMVNNIDTNNVRVWTNVGGNITNDENIGICTRDLSFDDHKGLVIVRRHLSISDVYFVCRWYNTSNPMPDSALHGRGPADYAAILDPGLNQLTHYPNAFYEDAWQVITEAAAAELGSVFWDENGIFRFWNRNTLLARQNNSVRSINLDDVEGLQITNSLDSVRNVISAASKRITSDDQVAYTTSSPDEVYAPAVVSGRTTPVYIQGIESIDPNQIPRYSTTGGGSFPAWDDNATTSGYVVQFLVGGVWQERDDFSSGVDILAQLDADGRLVLYIWNGYNYDARFATNSGSAALRITGSLQTDNGEVLLQAQDDTSIATYGKRNLALSGDWIQWQPAAATQLTSFVLPRSTKSIPTTDAITIAGDPRLQLGDTITLQDPEGLGEEMKLQIYGINRTFDRDKGLTDTLTVEMIRPAQIGYWDSPQYGLWDQTFIWSA